MKSKGVIFEDTVNYKKIAMTIMMPTCDFKCDRECGKCVCQNSELANSEDIDIDISAIFERYYLDNPITEALVFQGLEPFDSFDDLKECIKVFTSKSKDDIVIYTGYNEDEIVDQVNILMDSLAYNKLIIKYGRFIPDDESHYDEVLGINLASSNQYAKIVN